jgi:hypothetical protein
MKVKNLIFITLFLAAASLGLALPANSTIEKPPFKQHQPKLPSKQLSPDTQAVLDSVPPSILATVSAQCQAAIFSIVISPEFLKCIPIASFIPIIPIVTDPTIIPKVLADPVHNYKLVEGPFIEFATAFCPAPKCSDKGVQAAIKIIQEGCKTDLVSNPIIQLLFDVTVFYSPIRDITCFKDKSKFCWDESILTIINLPPSPFNITGNPLLDSIAVAEPQEICTKCNKDIVNTIFNFLKNNELALKVLESFKITDKEIGLAKLGVAVKCGAKFEDGTIP